uniref:Uncharacterized protein n=1 Tax=Triticum urartu TaxID=4572 RepID=A0A8R7UJD8_TRIUA
MPCCWQSRSRGREGALWALVVGGRGREVEVAVGAVGGAVLEVDAGGELVEAAGVDAEAEDEADGDEHEDYEHADAARLARAAAHLADLGRRLRLLAPLRGRGRKRRGAFAGAVGVG